MICSMNGTVIPVRSEMSLTRWGTPSLCRARSSRIRDAYLDFAESFMSLSNDYNFIQIDRNKGCVGNVRIHLTIRHASSFYQQAFVFPTWSKAVPQYCALPATGVVRQES